MTSMAISLRAALITKSTPWLRSRQMCQARVFDRRLHQRGLPDLARFRHHLQEPVRFREAFGERGDKRALIGLRRITQCVE